MRRSAVVSQARFPCRVCGGRYTWDEPRMKEWGSDPAVPLRFPFCECGGKDILQLVCIRLDRRTWRSDEQVGPETFVFFFSVKFSPFVLWDQWRRQPSSPEHFCTTLFYFACG